MSEASNLPEEQQKNLIRVQNAITFDNVQDSQKLFQVDKKLAEKIICAVICRFNETLNVSKRMTAIQIFETATLFCENYPHESASDLILCLKLVNMGKLGKNYNRVDTQIIFEYFCRYLDEKYASIESKLQTFKATVDGSVNTRENSAHLHQQRQNLERQESQAQKDALSFYQTFQNFKNENNQP